MSGLEKIWFIGDDFSNHTFNQHYKNASGPDHSNDQFYSFKHYEVREFSNNQYDSLFQNTAGRIRNSLLKAINEHNTLPKLIVTILDDDLIQGMNPEYMHFEDQLHIIMNWLVTEFERAIETYKEKLPLRAKRDHFPHFLWIAPPTHCNFGADSNNLRLHQTKCLAEVISTKRNMTLLKMVKFWEHEDKAAFLKEAYRFTSDGLDKYWLSIDSAIRYWDQIIAPKIDDRRKPFSGKVQFDNNRNNFRQDKFHWRNRRHFGKNNFH